MICAPLTELTSIILEFLMIKSLINLIKEVTYVTHIYLVFIYFICIFRNDYLCMLGYNLNLHIN